MNLGPGDGGETPPDGAPSSPTVTLSRGRSRRSYLELRQALESMRGMSYEAFEMSNISAGASTTSSNSQSPFPLSQAPSFPSTPSVQKAADLSGAATSAESSRSPSILRTGESSRSASVQNALGLNTPVLASYDDFFSASRSPSTSRAASRHPSLSPTLSRIGLPLSSFSPPSNNPLPVESPAVDQSPSSASLEAISNKDPIPDTCARPCCARAMSREQRIDCALKILRTGKISMSDFILGALSAGDAAADARRQHLFDADNGGLARVLNAVWDDHRGQDRLTEWILPRAPGLICETVSAEMDVVKDRSKMILERDLTESYMRNWRFRLVEEIAFDHAPVLVQILQAAAQSKRAQKENTRKNPRVMISVIVSQLANHRSHHSLVFAAGFGLINWFSTSSKRLVNMLSTLGLSIHAQRIDAIISSLGADQDCAPTRRGVKTLISIIQVLRRHARVVFTDNTDRVQVRWKPTCQIVHDAPD